MSRVEVEILTNYLIQPAPLRAIVSFDQFQALFPSDAQNSPLLRSLFTDLQSQRANAIDNVSAAIELEAESGKMMRREVLRQRQVVQKEEIDGEIELERALFAADSGVESSKHTLESILPELEGAADALKEDILRLEDEERALTQSIAQIIGTLSDLQYSKLSNARLPEELRASMDSLRNACSNKS